MASANNPLKCKEICKLNIKVTTLIENNIDDRNRLYNEHGLALYIEIGETKILFDTGKSGDFIVNSEKMNIDLTKLQYVILSHGHYDHSGGFCTLVDEVTNSFNLFISEAFFNRKYKLLEEGKFKYNGNSFDEEYLEAKNISTKYIKDDLTMIDGNIMIFSNFARVNKFELYNEAFKIEKHEKFVLDNFSDEIVLAIKSSRGLIVIVGCAHVGLVNILETIIERTASNIYAVIGGSHLVEADDYRLHKSIEFLKEKDIKLLAMCHCTGEVAMEKLKEEFEEGFIYNNTGNVINLI